MKNYISEDGNIKLIKGDCLGVMDELIKEGIKVDAIITDPPYGITACKWDSVIPFDAMWDRLNKLIKPNGSTILFGSEPFSSYLRLSNIKEYKYDWKWVRNNSTKYLSKKYNPLSTYEDIIVFVKDDMINFSKYIKTQRELLKITKKRIDEILGTNTLYSFFEGRKLRGVLTYSKPNKKHYKILKNTLKLDNSFDNYMLNEHTLNHQGLIKLEIPKIQKERKKHTKDSFYSYNAESYLQEYTNFPKDVLYFNKDVVSYHQTQKPVPLMEYLVKTYTNEGDTVLDFTCGSGSTGLACKNLNRKFIGIEMDEGYFDISVKRIKGGISL